MQGTWLVVSAVENGKPEKGAKEVVKLVIKDKTMTPIVDGREEKPATIKLDAGKKPRHIDLDVKDEFSVKGIYALAGDELKICFSRANKEARPTEFSGKEGFVLIVMKRMKP
jgi:uncharacterized protein (TIGR03067 family)